MKPFNLERALAGDPVVTRKGEKICRIIHIPESKDPSYKIVAIYGEGDCIILSEQGKVFEYTASLHDIFMAPVKKTWYFGSSPREEGTRWATLLFKSKEELLEKYINTSKTEGFIIHTIEIEE